MKNLAERITALRSVLAPRDDDGDDDDAGTRPRAARTAVDVRDLTIRRLEGELADARERSAQLERSHDELKFRTDVLERSYAKQFAEARERAASAEQTLVDERTRVEALEAAHADALRLLADARAMLAKRGAPSGAGARSARDASASDSDLLAGDWLPAYDGAMTINELIDGADRSRDQSAAGDSWAQKKVDAPADGAAAGGDMLAPESILSQPEGADD